MRSLLAAALGVTLSCLGCGGSTSSEDGAGGGGTGGMDGTGGSTGGATSLPLMPFADGRSWTFEVEAVDGLEPVDCPNQISTVSGVGQTPEGPGWRYWPACVPGIYLMVQDGDDIAAYAEVDGQLIEYMKEPVEEGASWFMYVWREAGEVTVPAGSFDECWRRELLADPNDHVIFCRGVGLVRSESASLNRRTLLAAKNF